MELCKYCGRDDHGVTSCWQKHDHEKMNLTFIRADHCVTCNKIDGEKSKEFLKVETGEEKIVCKGKDGIDYPRHQWVMCDNQITPAPPDTLNQFLFMCPDCETRKIANYALR